MKTQTQLDCESFGGTFALGGTYTLGTSVWTCQWHQVRHAQHRLPYACADRHGLLRQRHPHACRPGHEQVGLRPVATDPTVGGGTTAAPTFSSADDVAGVAVD